MWRWGHGPKGAPRWSPCACPACFARTLGAARRLGHHHGWSRPNLQGGLPKTLNTLFWGGPDEWLSIQCGARRMLIHAACLKLLLNWDERQVTLMGCDWDMHKWPVATRTCACCAPWPGFAILVRVSPDLAFLLRFACWLHVVELSFVRLASAPGFLRPDVCAQNGIREDSSWLKTGLCQHSWGARRPLMRRAAAARAELSRHRGIRRILREKRAHVREYVVVHPRRTMDGPQKMEAHTALRIAVPCAWCAWRIQAPRKSHLRAVNCSPWHQTGPTIYSTCAICRHAWVVKIKNGLSLLCCKRRQARPQHLRHLRRPRHEFCAEEHLPRTHGKRKGASHQHMKAARQRTARPSRPDLCTHTSPFWRENNKINPPQSQVNKQKRRTNNSSRT